jgi:polyhydroxyalkanoate synthesis regulator phasin
MTIEANIERIAVAAERQAVALEGILKANLAGAALVLNDAENQLVGELVESGAVKSEKEKSYAEKRKEEMAAQAKPVEEKKPRGRPPKVKEEPAPAPVEDEEDPFAAEPEPEVEETVTLEDVRKVLVELRTKVGKEKAYAFLREHGKGASCLPGSTSSKEGNGPGELKQELFGAVVKAAKKLLAA